MDPEIAAVVPPPLDGEALTPQLVETSALYEPFAAGLQRCAVVVDTRNMHGQARKMLGRGLRPSANGIRQALRAYGFEAVEIWAGVATKTMTTPATERVQSAIDDNKRYAVELVQQGAVVLGGFLADRGGDMEEKQVDVLLALQVADLSDRIRQLGAGFDSIVVLTEDMDLMPAYEFAHARGVSVYGAAFDTLHTRDDQRKWLLLDEPALSLMCPPPARISLGTPMRRLIARMATSRAPVDAPVWKVETWDTGKGRIVLSNSKGITGVLHGRRDRIRAGDRLNLFATGLEMEPASKRFPLLTLGRSRPINETFEGVEYARVAYWVEPTRVKVTLDEGGSATVTASPGQLLPGQRVVVLRVPKGDKVATYYVGPVGDTPTREGWPLSENSAVVTITVQRSKSVWEAAIDGLNTPVLIPMSYLKHAGVGNRLKVAHAGEMQGLPLVQPLSCCLPTPSE